MFPRIATHLLASLALAAAALLAGCATTEAPAHSGLQGDWRLDAAASDDAAAHIASAIRSAQARIRRSRRFAGEPGGPGGGPAPAAGGPGSSADDEGDLGDLGVGGGPMAPDFRALGARLQQELAAPRTLSLQSQAGDVLIQGDGLPGRDYQPGGTLTHFDEYGTSQLRTAWKDNAFLITQRYTSGAHLDERYALNAQGALEYTRSLRDPTVGKIDLRSVYRRAAP